MKTYENQLWSFFLLGCIKQCYPSAWLKHEVMPIACAAFGGKIPPVGTGVKFKAAMSPYSPSTGSILSAGGDGFKDRKSTGRLCNWTWELESFQIVNRFLPCWFHWSCQAEKTSSQKVRFALILVPEWTQVCRPLAIAMMNLKIHNHFFVCAITSKFIMRSSYFRKGKRACIVWWCVPLLATLTVYWGRLPKSFHSAWKTTRTWSHELSNSVQAALRLTKAELSTSSKRRNRFAKLKW